MQRGNLILLCHCCLEDISLAVLVGGQVLMHLCFETAVLSVGGLNVAGGWMTLYMGRGAKETVWFVCTFSCGYNFCVGGRGMPDGETNCTLANILKLKK